MRFKFESKWSKTQRQKQWHDWFAWHPIRINDEIVWLETVERKRTGEKQIWWHRIKK